jgi:hypothetical protein
MGWLKQHTGGYSAGLAVLALSLTLAAVLVVAIGRAVMRSGHSQPINELNQAKA